MPILGSVSGGGGKPGTPTVGAVTSTSATSISVEFTPPAYTGKGGTVTYIATSSPGGITGSSTTSPITVNGLTTGTPYTFTVAAQTSYGVTSAASGSSSSATPAAPVYSLASTFNSSGNYTIPAGKTSIAVAGVGAGQGGTGVITNSVQGSPGGASGPVFIYYDYAVSPGDVISVVVGAGSAGTDGSNNAASSGVTNVKLNTNTTLLSADGGQTPNTGGNVTISNMTLLGKVDGQQGGTGGSSAFPTGNTGNAAATVVSNITGINSYSGAGSGGGGGYGALSNTNNNTRSGFSGGAGGNPYGGTGGNGGSIAGAGKNAGNVGLPGNGPGGGGGGGGGCAYLVGASTPGKLGGNGASAQILLYVK